MGDIPGLLFDDFSIQRNVIVVEQHVDDLPVRQEIVDLHHHDGRMSLLCIAGEEEVEKRLEM